MMDRFPSHCTDTPVPPRGRGLPFVLGAALLGVFATTRAALWLHPGTGPLPPLEVLRAFAVGLSFDLAAVSFVCAPLLLWEAATAGRLRAVRGAAAFRLLGSALLLLGAFFLAAAEWFFWEEFTTRFNFIALDYLVYTREVVGNIRESYPVGAILAGCAAAATAAAFGLRKLSGWDGAPRPSLRRRLSLAALAITLPAGAAWLVDVDQLTRVGSATGGELAGNGLVTLVAAYRRNELDYDRFYATIPQEQADATLARLGVERSPYGAGPGADHAPDESGEPVPFYLLRRPRNVVLVSVESLSASFVGAYGGTEGLTPNLDRLAGEGALFENAFATGTPTVRGLEALSLGTPPIPGQAVVRRPGNAHLETLGGVLHHQGFTSRFVYGGYGFFDNMNAYFAANDYEVSDRTDFPAATIAHENVWGVADESLFSNALAEIDRDAATGKPFFVHVMTTSNHRPYTWPEGRIDLPQGTRKGAVRYSDWAIGRFFEDARSRRWFGETMFVIVADHCASVAGKTELPLAKYRIPLVFWGPGIVRRVRVRDRVSQIDVPPTVLDALGMDGDDYFFGREIGGGNERPARSRTFVSNYQSLGYYRDDRLVVLKPRRRAEEFRIDPVTFEAKEEPVDPELRDEAIAWYQTASRSFRNGRLVEPWYRPARGGFATPGRVGAPRAGAIRKERPGATPLSSSASARPGRGAAPPALAAPA